MAASEPETDVDPDETDVPAKPKRFSKRVLIIAGAVLLLLIGGGVAATMMLTGGSKGHEAAGESHDAGAEADGEDAGGHGGDAATYVDVPAMVVNLRGADGAARFLKIRFTIVPVSAAKGEEIKTKLPLLVDAFQPFLRELRPEDLAGSAAVFRVKEEMLVRATAALGPGSIKDILIQDLIQQ